MKKFLCLTTVPVILATIALIFTGCAGSQNSFSAKKHYVLDVTRDDDKISDAADAVLKIRRFRISNRFDQKELVYRVAQHRFESDFYNEFFTLPAALITEETRQWLTRAGIFKNILDISSQTQSHLLLEGYIFAIYGDFTDKNNPCAVLEVQIFILDETLPNSPVIFQQTYYVTHPLQSNQPDALINGLNVCLKNFLTSFEEDLRNIPF